MKTVTIFGAGVMGSAMTLPFADRGFKVRLVGTHLDGAIIESVKAKQFHPTLKVTLPQTVQAFSHDELEKAIGDDRFNFAWRFFIGNRLCNRTTFRNAPQTNPHLDDYKGNAGRGGFAHKSA